MSPGVFMPSVPVRSRPPTHRIALAMAVIAAALGVGLATGPASSAQSGELQEVRAKQDEIRAELERQNAAVDDLLGQVSVLRARERDVTAELAKEEAKLDEAQNDLAEARSELAETKRRLEEALDELEDLLVSIYRNGEPDAIVMLLNSEDFDQLAATSGYLERIRDYQSQVVTRVRDLRAAASADVEEVESSVARIKGARAAIRERQATLAASRASLEEREAALQSAQSDRREQLQALQGKAQSLVEALSAPDPEPTAAPAGGDGSDDSSSTAPAPAPSGSTASINSDGTATAPADAPQAVKDAIAAGNQITNAPYLYGGGHGSFDSPGGYDCSGSVSYALHGGGLLSSPLDSTGFMTWGDPGPGSWITVYSNPGHAYMVIAGIRFDTSGAPPRWQPAARDSAGFVATHPPGY